MKGRPYFLADGDLLVIIDLTEDPDREDIVTNVELQNASTYVRHFAPPYVPISYPMIPAVWFSL